MTDKIEEKTDLQERQITLADRLKARAANLSRRQLEEIVIILVDCSGSMSEHCQDGRQKIQAVRESIPYLQARGSYVEYGMIGFGDDARPIQNPISNFNAILIQLDMLDPAGMTNIPGALKVGLSMFEERTVEKKRMILLSDGDNNCDRGYMDESIQACVDQKVIVDCIAFGDNANINLLKSISTRTGGVFQKVDSPMQLEEAYKKLNFQIRYLENKNGGGK
jgi:Mg-chelatase subunit ChlD